MGFVKKQVVYRPNSVNISGGRYNRSFGCVVETVCVGADDEHGIF